MNPKALRLLIIGVALLIFGPLLGWVVFEVQQAAAGAQPDLPDFEQHSSWFSIRQFILWSKFTPMFIGVVSGAVGLFLILYALITHFASSRRNV